jgi:hypothetical protein
MLFLLSSEVPVSFRELSLCQSERAASHASICGHVRFSAPLPAIMPIWPPFTFSKS